MSEAALEIAAAGAFRVEICVLPGIRLRERQPAFSLDFMPRNFISGRDSPLYFVIFRQILRGSVRCVANCYSRGASDVFPRTLRRGLEIIVEIPLNALYLLMHTSRRRLIDEDRYYCDPEVKGIR